MNTDDLIQRLGDSLEPVRPIAPPWRRAAAWMAGAAVYLCGVALLAWARGRSLAGADLVQQAALIAIALAASNAAFASVVPASDRRMLAIPLVPGALLTGALVWGGVVDVRMQGMLGVGREIDWPCVVSISFGGVVLWAICVAMLRRGAPMSPGVSSMFAGVAAFSIANVEACLSRPHMFTVTILLWHGMTTALWVMALAYSGRSLLTWRRPRGFSDSSNAI